MTPKERLVSLCEEALVVRGLAEDARYRDRLRKELKAADEQGEHEYWLGLHDRFLAEHLAFPRNEHNNLIDWLLGLAPDFDIYRESAFVWGEMPDADIDYIKTVRDYLKDDWAPQVFGQENVCQIATYGTEGIKSAIKDMAKIHGYPHDEVEVITTRMKDKYTNDNGETQELEWDKALELYPDFKAYCDKYPEVAEAACMVLERNKTGGVHAGGLIISNERIDGFVPLEVRKVNKEHPNGVICAAWTEGLNRQDLGPVGLIKFDLLVINNLLQIALGCKLVKERYGLDHICALPGQWDWSDISYLNDPKAIAVASKGDLKAVFQFDSEGIRKVVRRGGVDRFDDLAAYSALYRPGPMNMGMHDAYCLRKRGRQPYQIHPALRFTLGTTYGVMAYQEQIMDILRVVGSIPDMHTEKVRKAISKKKKAQFTKYQEMFLDNGCRNLDVSPEYVQKLWDQVESFSAYGFNRSHAYAYAYVSARLLWLKANYPVEFYTAIMMCEHDGDKLKEYKLDAQDHGIKVRPLNINRSRKNFHIDGDNVYFGFANVKTIGEGAAEEVVAKQPYKNFTDFLDRFGTDAKALKAFTALGAFDDPYDRVTLRKFAEQYKKVVNTAKERQKRFTESMDKKLAELRATLLTEVPAEDPDFEKMCDFTDEAAALWDRRLSKAVRHVPYKYKGEERTREVTVAKMLHTLADRRSKSMRQFEERERLDEDGSLNIDLFNPAVVKLTPEEEEVLTDELVVNGEKTFPKAEAVYYGFQWRHRLETCQGYTGATISKFLEACDEAAAKAKGLVDGHAMIEVEIKSVQKRTSKGERPVEFYSLIVEDSHGQQVKVTVWSRDYTRFREELRTGKMVKMWVRPPSGGYNTFTFWSYQRNERLPPKEEDPRLIVMESQAEPGKTEKTLDEFVFDPSAISGIEKLRE